VDEAQGIVGMVLKASQTAAVVLQTGQQAFDLPAAAIAAQGPPSLGRRPLPIALVGGDEFNAPEGQALIQRAPVICPLPNQALGPFGEKTLEESGVDQGDFLRWSSRCVDGDRKTLAVYHRHEFQPFAPLGRSLVPSFFSPR
jgi:hypothetical protein